MNPPKAGKSGPGRAYPISDSPTPANRPKTGEFSIQGAEAYRWRKGQSGNPSGRPRMGALAKACRHVLEQPIPGDEAGRTYAQAIAERLAELAIKGHLGAARELADRAEGRAGQSFNVEIRPGRLEPEREELDSLAVSADDDRPVAIAPEVGDA